ncbi:hypothetical protein OBG91_10415 [Lactococcus lactis]|nr:hypothetical protein [Lactococcus lactis]
MVSSYPTPEQPDILSEKPSFIEDILEIEKIEKQHQNIEKKKR